MGGGHGHGHGPPYTVPDYKIYKVENCPELIDLQERLAEKGLKDPWIRNEAWRYDRKIFGTPASNLRSALTRGVGTGIVLTLITVLITGALSGKKSDHHSEHH